MPYQTPRERADKLLKIHAGSCFIPKGNELVPVFEDMQRAGIVTIQPTNSPTLPGVNVKIKGWVPHPVAGLDEPPAH